MGPSHVYEAPAAAAPPATDPATAPGAEADIVAGPSADAAAADAEAAALFPFFNSFLAADFEIGAAAVTVDDVEIAVSDPVTVHSCV